jgi:hypothetical protein
MAVPTYQGASALLGSTTTLQVPWPAGHQAGDIGFLLVENANDAIPSLSDAQGFTNATPTGEGAGTGGGATASRLQLFWCRATSSSMTGPTIADPGDHTLGQMVLIRGAKQSGSPIGPFGSIANFGSSFSVPSITTPQDDCLVVLPISCHRDSTAAFVDASTWNNFPPGAMTERFDHGDTTGNGGQLAFGDAPVAVAGATGSFTANVTTSSLCAAIIMAILPADPPNAGQFFPFF